MPISTEMEERDFGKAANDPLVSIVVPVYNIEEGTLRKCLQSVDSQSYGSIETLVVDDGSNEACAAVVDSLCASTKGAIAFHKENGGVSSARNLALRHARGEFVMFLDSDDYLASDCVVSDAVRLMEQENADIAFGQVIIEYPTKRIQESYDIQQALVLSGVQQIEKLASFFCSYGVPLGCEFPSSLRRGIAARMIRRDVIGDVVFDEEIHYGEDSLFDYYVTKKAKRVVLTNDPWYVYCQYQDSAIKTITFEEVSNQASVIREKHSIEPSIASERIANLFIRACTKEARNNANGRMAFKKALSLPIIQEAFALRCLGAYQGLKWKEQLMAFAARGNCNLLYFAIKAGCVLSDMASPLTRSR